MHFLSPVVLFFAGLSAAAPHAAPRSSSKANTTDPCLDGALSQVNSTHLTVDIKNPTNHTVALLSRHNILHHGAEHLSLQIRSTGNHTHNATVSLGPGAVRYIYPRAVGNDSYVTIRGGSKWSHTFDITQTFRIQSTGSYVINLQEEFSGAFISSAGVASSHGTKLQPIHVHSKPLTANISASVVLLKPRAAGPKDALAGCASQRTQLTSRIQAANDLANDALNTLSNATLLKTFFGIVKGQTDEEDFDNISYEIAQTYGKIAAYDPTKDTHITWNCASNSNPLQYCRSLTLGYYLPSDESINICPTYYTVSQSLACTQPSATTPALDEQDSVVLHELFHDLTFAPQGILDWPDPANVGYNCYNYNCATGFATQRDNRTLPEKSAINYEQFAQVARFQANSSGACLSSSGASSQSPPPPPTALDADQYGPLCQSCTG